MSKCKIRLLSLNSCNIYLTWLLFYLLTNSQNSGLTSIDLLLVTMTSMTSACPWKAAAYKGDMLLLSFWLASTESSAIKSATTPTLFFLAAQNKGVWPLLFVGFRSAPEYHSIVKYKDESHSVCIVFIIICLVLYTL